MNKKKILIVTTLKDFSVPFFLTSGVLKKISVSFLFLHEDTESILRILDSERYDFIYVRYPYNELRTDPSEIPEKMRLVFDNARGATMIDGLRSYDDILFEDKWRQYESLSEFMPETRILTDPEDLSRGGFLAKKRISSRAAGIAFSPEDLSGENPSEYILQDMLSIREEYRVYALFREIYEPAITRTSKRPDSKVKISGSAPMSDALRVFATDIAKRIPFDFIGLDIAWDGDRYSLLEVNRPCLFEGYYRETGVNLAEVFIGRLLSRSSVSPGAPAPNVTATS